MGFSAVGFACMLFWKFVDLNGKLLKAIRVKARVATLMHLFLMVSLKIAKNWLKNHFETLFPQQNVLKAHKEAHWQDLVVA